MKRLVHPTNTTKVEMKGNSSLLSLFEVVEDEKSHFGLDSELADCKANRESTRLFSKANTRMFSCKAFCCWLITDSSACGSFDSPLISTASVISAHEAELVDPAKRNRVCPLAGCLINLKSHHVHVCPISTGRWWYHAFPDEESSGQWLCKNLRVF